MYSPKIKPSLVKRLYYLKVKTGRPMTKLVNEMLEKSVCQREDEVYNPKEVNHVCNPAQ